MYSSDATYGDWLRLGKEDWERRLDLLDDPPFDSHSFRLWMLASFDLYGFFYTSIQFAIEGYDRRSWLADATSWDFGDLPDEGIDKGLPDYSIRWDDVTYGLRLPQYYSYVAPAVVRDAVELFERYLFCRVREYKGEPRPDRHERTPGWSELSKLTDRVIRVQVNDAEMENLRELRHSVSHRSLGPVNDFEQDIHSDVEHRLRPQALVDWLDMLEGRVIGIEHTCQTHQGPVNDGAVSHAAFGSPVTRLLGAACPKCIAINAVYVYTIVVAPNKEPLIVW